MTRVAVLPNGDKVQMGQGQCAISTKDKGICNTKGTGFQTPSSSQLISELFSNSELERDFRHLGRICSLAILDPRQVDRLISIEQCRRF